MAVRLILSGFRSIEECIRTNPDRIAKLLVPPGKHSLRIGQVCELAKKNGIRVEINPKSHAHDQDDESVLAILHDYEYTDFEALLDEVKEAVAQGERPVILILDGITDPQNLGAILRSAAFMGVSGVILPKDRSVAINDTVYRIASGGLEHVRVCQVTNLVSAVQALKKVGFWIIGFSEHSSQKIGQLKNDFAPVIIIGNEEKGMRPLVKENCDFLVKFVGKSRLISLNASVAAALAMAWATEVLSPSASDV